MSALHPVVAALQGRRYRYANEAMLHAALSAALTEAGIEHRREVRIVGGRIDFVIGRTGMEVKVKGSASALTRQITGYAADPDLDEFIVATTRPAHVVVPDAVGGKPIHFLNLARLSL